MWEPRPLTPLLASTACYWISFTIYLTCHEDVCGSGAADLRILNLGIMWRLVAALPPAKSQLPIEQEAGLAPKPISRLYGEEKYFLTTAGNRSQLLGFPLHIA
jgi:hypothetical protein